MFSKGKQQTTSTPLSSPMILRLMIVASLVATSLVPVFAFLPAPSLVRSKATGALCDAAAKSEGVISSDSSDGVISIDVSDLGLTMADLDKKIPIHDFRLDPYDDAEI
ncbi:hypothetical protein THAOC_22822 [Thalassiosira oceanica]|uniref:Uncharacterized protein n=1 Tax=Thalassiosira oceanica TaxID=159749 RepID=K0RW35_THAOC|nr:hypothetical protein THAOC_22822 [Thalassiosira oceanica]|eukprot:EJK57165.1 hypothetical protein THAOC_22822 [Thalassiosira oceanica]